MEKEFIPYEQALALKELGFNEPCFGWFTIEGDGAKPNFILSTKHKQDIGLCLAPTYSQAFRWFREKYRIEGISQRAEEREWYKFWIYELYEECKIKISCEIEFNSYEEAELACLKKLIEIVKTK